MRNLKLQFCQRVDLKIPNVKFFLTDASVQKKSFFYITENEVYKRSENGVIENIAYVPNIVGAEYLAMTDSICLATDDGRILSVDVETGALIENSFCDVGLTTTGWSPEQEVVVFVTKTDNVVVMTCTYDPITEHALQTQCEKEQQFINVGWGSKETQFHGSEGKNAAKQKTQFQKSADFNEDVVTDVEISWRYDGAYFAVSFYNEEYGRMFKVFNKEGELQYTSEKLNGLQTGIAWCPSGTWIAVPHALPNKNTVALFEKNGLRHREIVLPFSFKTEKISKLKWSRDSDILALHTKVFGESQEETGQNIYLYTIGNYHWYLKQTLKFNADEQISTLEFDEDVATERTLSVVLENGSFLKYRWHFHVDGFEKEGVVAVIDGNKLLLTNFSKSIIPPPMSAMQLEIDCNINACSFYDENGDGKNVHLCLYDEQERFHFYNLCVKTLKPVEKFSTIFVAENVEVSKSVRHLSNLKLCAKDKLFATICHDQKTNLMLISLMDANVKTYKVEANIQLSGIVNSLHINSAGNLLTLHKLDKYVIQFMDTGSLAFLEKRNICLPRQATEICCVETVTPNVISLCENQSLYINEQFIADGVTSFCLDGGNTNEYVIFTKHSELLLLRLHDQSVDIVRSIEPGGKLVSICPKTSRVILQMPRGNLEAFYPRPLLLHRVGKMLDNCDYNSAMDLLVRQRINLNIICDHNIPAFLQNISKFVDSITNIQWLNLFISDLRNEDVTKTVYANIYNKSVQKDRPVPTDFQLEEKVKYICEKLLVYLENAPNTQTLILPIITAKVKVNQLDAALELIWNIKKKETTGTGAKSEAEELLKFLLYLVEVNDLYNVALGTYDFGLVLFVAQKSQRDPREFLPFLNELKEHEINYRRFKIDEHLKRYEKALIHIAKCEELEKFDEALIFIKRQELYKQALKCYQNQAENYRAICMAYADHLRAEGKFDNASLMYERGGDMAQALRCAKHVLDWQRMLVLAYKVDPNNVNEVALSIVPALQENRFCNEAFHLLKNYGNDFVKAVESLLHGNLHLKAINETLLFQAQNKTSEDLLTSLVLPSLEAYSVVLDTNLLESQKTFLDYKQRLLNIREERARLKETINGGLNCGGDDAFDESDLLSDTTSIRSSQYSNSSRNTGKTSRSSKNRRKHQRKHFSLKPGNPFEDIALIDTLFSNVQRAVEQQEHLRDTCKALLELSLDDMAETLQRRYKDLITLMQYSLDAIWTPEVAGGQQNAAVDVNVDYHMFQNEQRYGLLDAEKRLKPKMKLINWEHPVLT